MFGDEGGERSSRGGGEVWYVVGTGEMCSGKGWRGVWWRGRGVLLGV